MEKLNAKILEVESQITQKTNELSLLEDKLHKLKGHIQYNYLIGKYVKIQMSNYIVYMKVMDVEQNKYSDNYSDVIGYKISVYDDSNIINAVNYGYTSINYSTEITEITKSDFLNLVDSLTNILKN